MWFMRPADAQSDQSICLSLEYVMIAKATEGTSFGVFKVKRMLHRLV